MVKALIHPNSTTTDEVRKALGRTGTYWGLKLGVSQRLAVSQAVVSRAASGKYVGRYKRIEIALLAALAKFEPEVSELVERLKKNQLTQAREGSK